MLALVTGGTGFLGQAVVARLLERGDRVTVLARPTSRIPPAWAGRVEVRYGDITDASAVASAVLPRTDTVFHVAALINPGGGIRRNDFYRVNVQGAENVLAAAVQSGVRRLVHVSSVAVYGMEHEHRGTPETAPYGQRLLTPYASSKIEAERRVLGFGRSGLLAVTVVRPGWIWGPGDRANLPRLMPLVRRGLVPLVGQGNNVLHLSYVENVADVCLAAATAETAVGQAYNVTDGGSVSFRQYVEDLVRLLGKTPQPLRIPFGLLYALATVIEGLYAILPGGRVPPLSRWHVLHVRRHMDFSIEKARRELGYAPRVSYQEGLRRLAPWLRTLARNPRAAAWEVMST